MVKSPNFSLFDLIFTLVFLMVLSTGFTLATFVDRGPTGAISEPSPGYYAQTYDK